MDFYLQQLYDAITSTTHAMTREQLTRHPDGKWCMAEILEHLYLTYTGTVKGFVRCLEAGTPTATSPTLKHRLSTMVVVGLGYLPEGRKSPPATTPRGLPSEKVVAEIGLQIAAMDEAIRHCEECYGKHTRLVDHPILGPLSAHQWRKFHWVHGRHHMKQILRLRRS